MFNAAGRAVVDAIRSRAETRSVKAALSFGAIDLRSAALQLSRSSVGQTAENRSHAAINTPVCAHRRSANSWWRRRGNTGPAVC